MNKSTWHRQIGAFLVAALALLAGCRSALMTTTEVDFNASLARASELKQPMIVLVAELGLSRADDDAAAFFESKAVMDVSQNTVRVLLDISNSRNRAIATRFHVTETPMLLCLSSLGVIVSRDEKPITKNLMLKRIEEATQQGPQLDAQFDALSNAARKEAGDFTAQFALTDFLLDHHNAVEAIPTLAAIAHSESNAPAVRIRAWVALARAHLWIAEPEKGSHEAEALTAELGARNPEARAGGELVLGFYDAASKRPDVARREFGAAIAAAPESTYGRQAVEALANLPKGGQ